MASLKFDRRRALIVVVAAILLPGMTTTPTNDPPPPGEPSPASAPVGKWAAEAIDGEAVADSVQTTLEITADGSASGKGGCNNYRGSVTIDGKKLTFGPTAATMMMCAEPAMGQERRFLHALAATRSFAVDGELGKLLLRDESDTTIVVLSPLS